MWKTLYVDRGCEDVGASWLPAITVFQGPEGSNSIQNIIKMLLIAPLLTAPQCLLLKSSEHLCCFHCGPQRLRVLLKSDSWGEGLPLPPAMSGRVTGRRVHGSTGRATHSL